MRKWVVLFFVLLLVLIGRTLYRAGSFKSIDNHFLGTIEKVYKNVPGTEDLDIDYQKNILFISSTDRWKIYQGKTDGIYSLALDSNEEPIKIPTDYSGEFHPHGISYLKLDSISMLFVINHNDAGNFVEVFEYKNDSLLHRKTFTDSMMCCPNDLVATDTDKFYVTNDHGSPKGFMRTLEDYLLIPRSYLLYFNGRTFSKVFTGMCYGNGVNISRDGKKLFLATTTGRTLLTFDRDVATGDIKLANELDLYSGIDNVNVDEDGNLWVAAHPKLLAFVDHAKDSSKRSPSQVFKLTPNSTGYDVQEVFLNDGSFISGSSVALHVKDKLFIGVVFESKLLKARLDPDH